jgi:hypothetical protein
MCFMAVFSLSFSLVQLHIPDELRGRLCEHLHGGLARRWPIGGLVAGAFADRYSASSVQLVNGVVLAIVAGSILLFKRGSSSPASDSLGTAASGGFDYFEDEERPFASGIESVTRIAVRDIADAVIARLIRQRRRQRQRLVRLHQLAHVGQTASLIRAARRGRGRP